MSFSCENRIEKPLVIRCTDGDFSLRPIQKSASSLSEVWIGRGPAVRFPEETGRLWSGGFKDQDILGVARASLSLKFWQTSNGVVGVDAIPNTGYRARVLVMDRKTRQAEWDVSKRKDGGVELAGHSGNLYPMPSPAWTLDLSRTGRPVVIRGGVIEIGGDGRDRLFGVAAEFCGQADNWLVHAGIIELQVCDRLQH